MYVYKCFYELISIKVLLLDKDLQEAFNKAIAMESVITGKLKRIDYVRSI